VEGGETASAGTEGSGRKRSSTRGAGRRRHSAAAGGGELHRRRTRGKQENRAEEAVAPGGRRGRTEPGTALQFQRKIGTLLKRACNF
jgi:hypothetical protein